MQKKRTKITAIIIISIIIAALLCLYFAGRNYFSKHFYGNTTVNGYDVGNMSSNEAKQSFENILSNYALTIQEEETQELIRASDVGMYYVSLDGIDECLNNQNANIWFISMWQSHQLDKALNVAYDSDKMQNKLNTLMCYTGKTSPQDAYLSYDSSAGAYEMVSEVQGDTYDKEKVEGDILSALSDNTSNIDVTEYKYLPTVTTEDNVLNSDLETLNKMLSSSITYKDGYYSFTIDKDAIQSFIVYDRGEISLDDDIIRQYLTDNVCPIFTTLGTTRTLTTPMSGTFDVSGGTYGYDVWRKEEVEQLKEEITNGETVERKPIYYQEGYSWGEHDDIGTTYIDVSIGNQMVSLVQDGEITVESDMVSGNPSKGNGTPLGIYQVEFKTTNYTMVKYDTFVNYWMPIDFDTGVGLHDATWRSNFGGSIYQTNGSHGCINLPYDVAKDIYERIDEGIPVIVH